MIRSVTGMSKSFLRRSLALACAATVAAGFSAPALAAVTPSPAATSATLVTDHDGPWRGDLVSAKRIARLSGAEVAAYLREAGFPAPGRPAATDVYAVTYRTPAVDGAPTAASGVVALPRASRHRLPTVIYEHGTMADKNDAGSVADGDGRAVPILFASSGFVGVAPDYLGLGTGPGHHPYMHAASEATASVDLLRAARELAGRHHTGLDGRVMVTGFSQGGQASMALSQALRAGADRRFRLVATAPISGPYDVAGAELPALLGGRLHPQIATFYIAYWTVSMNRLYGLYADPAEVFRAPYDATVEKLFDGRHSMEQIGAGLPSAPGKLLTPAYTERLAHPDGGLLRALRENDGTCDDWTPGVPVRLFAARGDKEVAIADSRHCLRDLRAAHVKATLTDVGDVDHTESAFRAIPRVYRWFLSLR